MKLKHIAATALLALSANTYADVGDVTAKVTRVLHTDDNKFGGCMAHLDVNPATVGLDCRNWVSFSCTGDFTSKDNAYRMYDLSQMAFAMNKRVKVFINDEQKHNGFCVAERIDVLAN
ncbi:MAG: hypothetical protein AAGE59_09535 [Cyanobacteria bacterium P01_F01_bin.86]